MSESQEHFLLKQVGLLYLKLSRRCQYIGTEIAIPQSELPVDADKRLVADVVGVRRDPLPSGRRGAHPYRWTIYTVEVKVSRSDFKAGYCRGGHYVFLLTPPGLLSSEELPEEDGLLEADPDVVSRYRQPEELVRAMKVCKPACRRKFAFDYRGLDPGVETATRIAATWTNWMVYRNPYLTQRSG